jgi:triphosphoribosyl-dephospho-CoA synthase
MPNETSTTIGNCASLAALLEVSAYPKPGNIHRLNDFDDTSYEHFLAGSVALGSVMGELAARAANEKISNIRVGKGIIDAVKEMFEWQHGGNIHLGVILLLAPISAGAGLLYSTDSREANALREQIRNVITAATPLDSIDIYKAIDIAMSQENLGSAEELDVKDKQSRERIREENITPLEIFKLCCERDQICREWVSGFKTVFETGYPYLSKRLEDGASINDATVDTFLNLLSVNHDSLIARKKGVEVAKKVSAEAKKILEAGGIESDEGKMMLWRLDEELRMGKGVLNPGTTADLTAASLYVLLLTGWRP